MKNKLRGSAKDVSDSFVAAAAVAQSVKRSELSKKVTLLLFSFENFTKLWQN